VLSRNRDAVDVRFRDARDDAERLGHFAGRDVLALPAERVADAVDEIEIAVGVAAHQVAGADPHIALREGAAQGLFLGVGFLRVAFDAAPRLAPPLPDGSPRLARGAFD